MTEGPLTVAIGGGGLAGLTAAIALCQLGAKKEMEISVTIIEKDPSPEARIQGYRLGVSARGAAALDEIGILQEVAKRDAVTQAIRTGQWFLLATADGSYLAGADPKPDETLVTEEEERIRLLKGNWFVNRGILRTVLLEELSRIAETNSSVDAEIVWGAQVVGFDLFKHGDKRKKPVQVSLSDGTRIQSHVLLGCDGIFSAVRRYLHDAVYRAMTSEEENVKDVVRNPPLRHLGVGWVRGVVEDRGQLAALFPDQIPPGDAWSIAMGDTNGSALFAECSPVQWGFDALTQQKAPVITWFFAFRLGKNETCPERSDSEERVAKEVLARMGDPNVEAPLKRNDKSWHPAALQLVRDTLYERPDSLLFRVLYDRGPDSYSQCAMPPGGPPLASWDWVPVTLLGDSYHPVASYALSGGGSDAMADGVDVATELIQGIEMTRERQDFGNIALMLRRYEASLRTRYIAASRRSGYITPLIHSGWLSGRMARVLFALLRNSGAVFKVCFATFVVGLALKISTVWMKKNVKTL